jgi:hypothetical protein
MGIHQERHPLIHVLIVGFDFDADIAAYTMFHESA